MNMLANPSYQAKGIQEVKYDCLAYLKEFGTPEGGWMISLTDNPERFIDKEQLRNSPQPWLIRATLSARAAQTVADFLCERFLKSVYIAASNRFGRVIILQRRVD